MKQTSIKRPSSPRFILTGFALTGIVACISFLGAFLVAFTYTDFSGNATLQTWNRLIYMSLPVVTAFSLAYFSRRQIKHLASIHLALIVLVFLITASIRFVQINEQQQIQQRYQQFIEFVRRGKTTEASTFMHPDYRLMHETLNVTEHTWLKQAMNIEDISSPYSIHIQSKNRAIIVPDPRTNQWYHPAEGIFLELEKFEGEWYFTGDGGLYLGD